VIDQLCICLRYVFNGKAEERVLALIPLDSGTGVHQFTKIKEVLVNNNIDIQHLISVSFDGAANMSGTIMALGHLFKKKSHKQYTPIVMHML